MASLSNFIWYRIYEYHFSVLCRFKIQKTIKINLNKKDIRECQSTWVLESYVSEIFDKACNF